jgi:hypothetical protein
MRNGVNSKKTGVSLDYISIEAALPLTLPSTARLTLTSLRAQEVQVGGLISGVAFYNILDVHPFQYIKFFLHLSLRKPEMAYYLVG